MGSPTTLRIFFSSPGDVKMERETARRIVERLQAEVGPRFTLEPYFWEHEVMVATKDYQQNIPAMDGFDVVVCMLWSRLGSPLHPERHPRPGGGYFESGTEYEFFTARQAHQVKGTPDIFVFRNRTEPRRPSRPKEAREAVDREVDRLDTFFERYFREGDYFTGAVNSYRTLGEFEDKLTQALRAYLEQALPSAASAPGAVLAGGSGASGAASRGRAHATYTGRPYLGLAAFDFADAPVFFGRTAQVGEVVTAFQTQEMEARATGEEGRRFVLILGASGSGKSSLARAGVLPMLVQPGVVEGAQAWRRALFRPGEAGGDPFLALATALLAPAALPELGSDGTTPAALAGLLRRQPAGAGLLLRQALSQAGAQARLAEEQRLRDQLRQLESESREDDAAEVRGRLTRLTPPAVRLALLADQLEELFTTDQAGEVTAAFIAGLAALAASGRVFVLGTLRSDFYARCLEHPQLVELMRGSGSYALPAPGPADLGQMIRQPAVAAGLAFEENSASGEKLDELLRDAALRDPAALPLLSYTLEQLHERRTPAGLLTLAAYHDLGGLEGAIGRRAETVFSALPAPAQAAFDGVWRQLVTLGQDGAAVRRRTLYRPLTSGAGATGFVDALVAARLLTADQAEGGERSISVAHEALLRHWPRVVRWVEDNRDFLRARSRLAARLAEWLEHARADAYLLPPGPALAEAEAMLARHTAALDAPETDYVRRSTARARAHEQARLRRARLVTTGAVSLSILALAGGAFAWRERGHAEVQRAVAEAAQAAAEADRATAQTERATAVRQKEAAEASTRAARASQTRAAYLLGVEMLEARKSREGLTSLAQALTLDPAHAGARDRLYSYHLYGLPKAINLRSVAGPPGVRQRLSGAALGPTQRILYLDATRGVEIFDLATREVVAGPWSQQPDAYAALLNRPSTHVLHVRRDGSCRVWALADGTVSATIQPDADFTQLAFSDDARWLAEGGPTGRVRLWDLTSGTVAHTWQQRASITDVLFHADNRTLAVVGGDLVLFDLENGTERVRLGADGHTVETVRFAAEAPIAAYQEATPEGTQFRFIDLETGALVEGARALGTKRQVFDFTLNHDGTALALASFSADAFIWHRDDAARDRSFTHDTYPMKVCFTPDDRLLVTATSEGTVRIWNADAAAGPASALAFEPISHDGRLEDLAVSWDGRYLLTGTARHARLWDLAVGRALTLPLAHEGLLMAGRFNAAGDRLWTVARGSGLQAWDPTALERSGPALLPAGSILDALINPTATRAVLLLPEHQITFCDLATGEFTATPWTTSASQSGWSLSDDGRHLAVAAGPTVTLLDATTAQPVGAALEFPAPVFVTQLDATGERIATACEGTLVRLHDRRSGTTTDLATDGCALYALQFSPDGRWLAGLGGGTGNVAEFSALLWDLQAPDRAPRKLAHNDRVLTLRFSPEGSLLATGTKDQLALVWDVGTGQRAGEPIVQADVVRDLAFSPDGRLLATAAGDDSVRVWDWREARPVSERFTTDNTAFGLTFTPDGRRLLAMNAEGGTAPAKAYASLWEIATPPDLALDLIALTEGATALRVSANGLPAACDPFEGWERVRQTAPASWFFQPPARRSLSPAFTASSLRWINDDATGIDQPARAMPAVSIVRAAMSFWKQKAFNRRLTAWQALDEQSPEHEPERLALVALNRDITTLVASASRGGADDPGTLLSLSLQAEAADELAEARRYIARALELAPEDRQILNQASDVLRAVKAHDALFPVLTRLRAVEPDRLQHRSRLATNRWHARDLAAARAEAAAIVDDPALPADERPDLLVLLGRTAEALALWQAGYDAETRDGGEPSVSTLLSLVIGHELCGERAAAIAAYCELIAHEANAARVAVVDNVALVPELKDALRRALDATLAAHPELRPAAPP